MRFKQIAERFLKIWEYPNINLLDKADNCEINIFEAEEPKHKKLEYAVFCNQKIEVTQVSKLYVEIFKRFFETQPETFFTTDLGFRIGLTKNPDETGLRQAVSKQKSLCDKKILHQFANTFVTLHKHKYQIKILLLISYQNNLLNVQQNF